MLDRPVFEEREDGPLGAKGVISMVGTDGGAMETQPVMALCRCGASANKPFCDGSHRAIFFKSRGGVPGGKDKQYTYKGEALTVLYNPLICSHAAECVSRAPRAFNPNRRQWIEVDAVSEAEVRDVVRACPSGALVIEGEDHMLPENAQVTIQKNGPYWVLNADLPVKTPGVGGTEDKVVLCRCGKSGNKPFCDGAHRDAGWED